MATQDRKPQGFVKLIKAILSEIEDPALFDARWKSTDAFESSYGDEEYPIDNTPGGSGTSYDFSSVTLSSKAAEKSYDWPEEEGGPPEHWVSETEYYFRLASNHERIKTLLITGEYHPNSEGGRYDNEVTDFPGEVANVGDGHRMWLDVDVLLSAMDEENSTEIATDPDDVATTGAVVGSPSTQTSSDLGNDGIIIDPVYSAPTEETSVASSKQNAAKRIEFLCQLLKMCIVLEEDENEGFSSDAYNDLGMGRGPSISPVSSTVIGQDSPEDAPINGTHPFMINRGSVEFTFTSPRVMGRQVKNGWDTEKWPKSYPEEDTYDFHCAFTVATTNEHPASLNPEDRGLSAEDQDYASHGRFTSQGQLAIPYLVHEGKVDKENYHEIVDLDGYDEGRAIYPSLQWEKWKTRVNFESFLLWSAELIELLHIYYAYTDWSSQIATGTKPVFFGGKRYMSFPYDDTGNELYGQGAGYAGIYEDLLSEMSDEIIRTDLLISPDIQNWWLDFLQAYTKSASELAEDEAATATAADSASSVDGSSPPEAGSTLNIEQCTPEADAPEATCPDDCVPNLNAISPDWTLFEEGTTFFNERTCEYSIVMQTTEFNPYDLQPDQLTTVVYAGTEKLLKAYLKSEYIKVVKSADDPYGTGSGWSEAAGIFLQTAFATSDEEGSIKTMDVIFGEDASTLIQSNFGFLPEIADFPGVAENGFYIPEKALLLPRILVVVPAKLFNKIPADYSSLKEIKSPQTGIKVKLLMSDLPDGGLLSAFTRDMVSDVCSAMKYYGVEYAAWARFKDEAGGDYGDLNLEREASKIKSFIKSLKIVIQNHGFAINRVEYVEIGFNEELTMIDYLSANEYGCPPVQLLSDTTELGNALYNFDGHSWASRRTLAYIQRLPDMWNDVKAREPMEWNDFIIKYTVDLPTAASISEGMPTIECEVFGDESVGAAILSDTLDGILDLPSALADKYNKAACSDKDYVRSGDVNYAALWDDVKKRGIELGLEEFFADDSMLEQIKILMDEGYPVGPIALWDSVYHRFGYCGLLSLIDLLLGCMLQGVPTADGLSILVEAALRALGPLEMETWLKGLSPQQQQEIAQKTSEKLGLLFAVPPWEGGTANMGSWSSGPAGAEDSPFEKAKSSGKILYDALPNTEQVDDKGNYDFSLGSTNYDYVQFIANDIDNLRNFSTYVFAEQPDGIEWMSNEAFRDALGKYGYETETAFPQSTNSLSQGNLGVVAQDFGEAILDAYKDVLLEGLSEEEMLAQLNALPGAEIIMGIYESLDCNIPDVLDPSLDDFFKSLNLDFCRGLKPVVVPEVFFEWNVNLPDMWGILMDTFKEVMINLICTAMIKIIAGLLEKLLDSMCNALEGVTAALGAAITGDDITDAFRDAFCDPSLSSEEINEAMATLAANLNGCDPEKLKADSSAFIADIALVLSGPELADLFNCEASPRTLSAVTEIAKLMYPDSYGACDGFSTSAGVSNTFCAFGSIIPEKYKNMPPGTPADRPVYPALCNEEALEQINDMRCQLYSQRGMTEEQCADALEQIRKRTGQEIAQLATLAQNGIEDLLPPLFSSDPCAASIFPAVDPISSAASSKITSLTMDILKTEHRKDLVDDQTALWRDSGKGGIINMIMSNKYGEEFTRHFKDLQKDEDQVNRFPEKIATHLVENHLKEGGFFTVDSRAGVETTSETEEVDAVWGIDRARSFITDIDDSNIGKHSTVNEEETPEITRKKPDVVMGWKDYTGKVSNDTADFKLEYSSFELDESGKSIMNDYCRIRMSDTVNASGFGSYDNVPRFGFENIYRSEASIQELVDLVASTGSMDLNIDDHLDGGKSPRHALYAQHIIESMKSMSPSSVDEILSNYDNIFSAYYDDCDNTVETYFKKMGERVADNSNSAWKHGFPTTYDADGNYETGLATPSVIFLDATFKNPKTGVAQSLDPESYGGSEKHPAFYMPPPVFDGWSRIMQIFAPEPTGCEPSASPGVDFDNLVDYHDNLYDTIKEDERLSQNPSCAIEHPWNKIFDRASTCGVEMMVRTVLRVYIVEWFISGIPSFTTYKTKFPTMLDDSVLDFIADRVEAGLIEQNDPGWFDVPNEYYFMFMEQAAQTFDRMFKRGEIEDVTDAEKIAMAALLVEQQKWSKNVHPELALKSYPGLMTAGIMTAIASPFGPEASLAGSLVGSILSDRIMKKRKREYWTSYISDQTNLGHVRTLMRRIIRQELEYVSASVSKSMEPPLSDMPDLFLSNEEMIIGSISSAGPFDVATYNGSELMHDSLSKSSDKVEDTPYMLERYIKVSDYGSSYEYDLGTEEEASYNEKKSIVRREDSSMEHLHGVINMDDWEEYLSDNATIFEGKTVKDFWESWEFGVRIVHVANSATTVSSTGWEPFSVTMPERLENKAFEIGIDPPMDAADIASATTPSVPEEPPKVFIVPLVSVEKESDSLEGANIEDIAGSLKSIYDAELACLVSDLVEDPRYNMLFRYCIPLPRYLSVLTIYIMNAFVPSVGSELDWEEFPGGKNRGIFNNDAFIAWNKRDLFPRSKKLTRSMFIGYYKATDLDWTPPKNNSSDNGWDGISWSLFWWLRNLQKFAVLDSDGNPC